MHAEQVTPVHVVVWQSEQVWMPVASELKFDDLKMVEIRCPEDAIGLNVVMMPDLPESHPLRIPLMTRVISRVRRGPNNRKLT